MAKQLPNADVPDDSSNRLRDLGRLIEQLVSKIPRSSEQESRSPNDHAREIVNRAAAKAAMVSGGLALPSGPLGILTIIPDLLAIWHIQRQMVADVAAIYGKSAELSPEVMIYCLFKHAAAQAVRDLIVRVGERMLVRKASVRAIQQTIAKVAVKVAQGSIRRTVSRLLPIIGAVGVGAYAFYDTSQVGKTAITLFSSDLLAEPGGESS